MQEQIQEQQQQQQQQQQQHRTKTTTTITTTITTITSTGTTTTTRSHSHLTTLGRETRYNQFTVFLTVFLRQRLIPKLTQFLSKISVEHRFRVAKVLNFGVRVRLIEVSAENRKSLGRRLVLA